MTQPPQYPPPGSTLPFPQPPGRPGRPGTPPAPFPAPPTHPVPPTHPTPPAPPQPSAPRGALDYPVFFNPALAQQRYAEARRNRTYRIISLLISVAISAAVWWFWREQIGGLTWWLIGIGLALPTLFLIKSIIVEFVAKAEAGGVHDGLALGVGREGVFANGTMTAWREVGRLYARPGRWGRSPRLVIERRDGRSEQLPLDFLSGMPATIDSGIRALSGGRLWVDFSALDA